MSTCGEVGSGVHALIKKLAIRRVEHRLGTRSNESQHLVEGTEIVHLRRRFSFVLQQALLFRPRHHLCRQRVVLASTRQPRSQGPVSVHTHGTEEVTGSKGREGANGVGGRIGVGGGNGDGNGVGGGNGDVNGDRDGDGDGSEGGAVMRTGTGAETLRQTQNWNGEGSGNGPGTGMGVETRRRTQNGNGDGNGDENENSSGDGNENENENGSGDENGDENENSSGDGSGDEVENGDRNEDGIGEGIGKAKKRKKSHKNCRRDHALLFCTRHHLCRQRVSLVGTRHLR